MGVQQTPTVCVVDAIITPLLWVRKSQPVIVLPKALLSRFTDEQIACVVTHELAHFARRDYWSNALACFVGCLFWWNPAVWLAQRELKIAQEACCDATVIAGAPTIRRTYAGTLLQVMDFVGGERLAPQLTSNFGEAFSITRRFEMIANERVTHRLSRVTGLLAASLFGLACCYPVLAQQDDAKLDLVAAAPMPDETSDETSDEKSDEHQAQRNSPPALDNAQKPNEGSDEPKTETLKYNVEFQWAPRYTATATFKYLENSNQKGVLTLRAERYPKSSMISLLQAMHAAKSLRIAQVTTENPTKDSGGVTVILKSEPFASSALNSVIIDISTHFKIDQLIINPSGNGEPIGGAMNTPLNSLTKRSDAKLQDARQQDDLLNAVRSSLPPDAANAGWLIQLQNHQFYEPTRNVPANWAPLGKVLGDLADHNTNVEDTSDKTALRTRFYLFEKANHTEAAKRVQAMNLRNVDIVPDAHASRILVIATAKQHERIMDVVTDLEGQPVKTESRITGARTSTLDGHWIVERTIHNGKEHPTTKQFKFYTWSFDSNARTLSTQWRTNSGKAHKGVLRFVQNTSTTPKQLTAYGEKSLLQAIYEFDGDRLRIAVFGKSELERPPSFESQSTSKAGPLVVYELKRFAGPSSK